MADRTLLTNSRLGFQVLECLFLSPGRWVNHNLIREWLVANTGWWSYHDLRCGPGGEYEDYFGGVLALLEEVGCVERDGWSYRYVRMIGPGDVAPIVHLPSSEICNDQEESHG